MNRDSSRSHCIFTIYVETAETSHPVSTQTQQFLQSGKQIIRMGKLHLVDLAGSEK